MMNDIVQVSFLITLNLILHASDGIGTISRNALRRRSHSRLLFHHGQKISGMC